ncbi:MAG: hypothetical protein GF309_07300 [Candidatus Lokiarchaeota archaeon]|nr:hypothetical protein [Candidatus Lokiarchaeota archaeon]
MSKRKGMYVGLGIILGAAAGVLLFILANQAWYIGAGVGIGLVLGAILEGLQSEESESAEVE